MSIVNHGEKTLGEYNLFIPFYDHVLLKEDS